MQDAATSVATPTGRRTGHRRVAAAIPRVSARGDAAIDDEFAAGDETRLVRGEVEGESGDLLRLAQPAERDLLLERPPCALRRLRGGAHRPAHPPRGDGRMDA